MSMLCGIVGVSPSQIGELRTTPSLANDLALVAQDEAGIIARKKMIERLAPDKRAEAEARFNAMERIPEFQAAQREIDDARAKLAELGPLEPALELQKSWHILHYTMSGNVWGAGSTGDALVAGEDLGNDMGYGPPRLHDPASTKAFGDFIAALDLEQIQSRIQYQELLNLRVYGVPMGRGSEAQFEDELRTEVATYFPQLRDYVKRMSQKGNGLLIWLT